MKKNPSGIKDAFSDSPVIINKTPIVAVKVGSTYYIIDGHHRWSQTYCLNPNAKMTSKVIESDMFKTADDALKLVQMQLFIAKDCGKLPQATVDSKYNLYTIDEESFKKWCVKTMTDEASRILAKYRKNVDNNMSEADDEEHKRKLKNARYLWNNVLTMRKDAAPTKNAHGRGDMPQTDQVSGNYMKKTVTDVSKKQKNESLARRTNKKQINESFKNAILGMLRIRSNMTALEDLVDAINTRNFKQYRVQALADTLSYAICDLKHKAKAGSVVSYNEIVEALKDALKYDYELGNKVDNKRYFKTIGKIAEYLLDTVIADSFRQGEISRQNAELAKCEAALKAKEYSYSGPPYRDDGNGWLYDPAYGGWTYDRGSSY